MIDYRKQFRNRFDSIDRNFTKELAIKKKKDIRRITMTDGPEYKKIALQDVWAEQLKAGKI